jgi:AraC family transcriptional regulator
MANMMTATDGLYLTQAGGFPPTTVAFAKASGESGVSALHVRFEGSAHFDVTMKQHLICFVSQVRIECSRSGKVSRHNASFGSLAIVPHGSVATAYAKESMDALLVAIDPGRLGLVAAERTSLEAQLIDRSIFPCDRHLLDLARAMIHESANAYPNGPLFWHELATNFVDGLVARHTSQNLVDGARGTLGKNVLHKIREYVTVHLDEPIEIATLARMAGRSSSRFSHVFRRSVGVSPYRFVMYLRLKRAIELVRDGRSSLAEIAASTGFADQSHLSRWVSRVYGAPPTQLVA